MARSNKERTEATRLALIEAARRLFVEKGYAETATPDIVGEAGVTRGALYHHFEDKKALFRAVLEREAQAVAERIEAVSVPAGTPREALLLGASAYFDAMAAPGRTRLLLLEAPAVLGFEGAGAIERDNAESTLETGLSALLGPDVEAGKLVALTGLLSAAFDRAAIAIEAGGDRKAYEGAIAALLDGLRA
ncbi:TetR/AcrR family transcriptional regulator [Shinella zoogloeoides]|uniref:TetR family transcriptional regulator n=1 Tax=Shinella zoogloeoides TaxID=352475 RepID=A0A6N8TEM2_SHIZO|nr:TetR family transcriptional regulator [Shinella zoogloeoides]MXO01399.1 TetR family transcriptional regulator [Shinella zoogloeoides]UEX81506.1 TetR family transcriptional regulator [Shinella zoogloeoides]